MQNPYFSDGDRRVYLADFRDIIDEVPECAAIITDIPFSSVTHTNNRHRTKGMRESTIKFDSICLDEASGHLALLATKTKGWLVASADYRHLAQMEQDPPLGLRLLRIGVWVKTNPTPQLTGDRPAMGWEAIGYFHRDDVKPQWNGGGCHGNFILPTATATDHPTEKPVSMLMRLVEQFTQPGELVWDPFCGSGTTLLASKLLGRVAIGCDIDEHSCHLAATRLRQATLPI